MEIVKSVLSVLAIAAVWATSAAALPPLRLDELVDEALAANPGLDALRARVDAARARIPQAGALADPQLRLDFSNVPLSDWSFSATPMSGKQLTVSQRVPYRGKRAARERMAQYAAAASRARYQGRVLLVANTVKQAYYSLAFLDRAIEINQRNRELLGGLVRIATAKYSVGRRPQQDVRDAQLAQYTLDDRLIVLNRRRRHGEAVLNAVLNRLPQEPLGPTPEVTLAPFAASVDSLQRLALTQHPAVRAILASAGHWQTADELAQLERRPDFNVFLSYRQRQDTEMDAVRGSDFVSAAIAINLPLHQGRRQDQQQAEARAQLRASEADLQERKQQIFLRIQQLCVAALAHRDQAELLRRSILPQAEQSMASRLARYQVDDVGFSKLLDSQLAVSAYEIDYYRHVTDFQKTLCELESAVGIRLF